MRLYSVILTETANSSVCYKDREMLHTYRGSGASFYLFQTLIKKNETMHFSSDWKNVFLNNFDRKFDRI